MEAGGESESDVVATDETHVGSGDAVEAVDMFAAGQLQEGLARPDRLSAGCALLLRVAREPKTRLRPRATVVFEDQL